MVQNSEPLKYLNNLSKTKRKTIFFIYNFFENAKKRGEEYLFFSQRYIARAMKCSREWINKILKELIEMGLLVSIRRGRQKTNLYFFNTEKFASFLYENPQKSSHHSSHRTKVLTEGSLSKEGTEVDKRPPRKYEHVELPFDLKKFASKGQELLKQACTLSAFPENVRVQAIQQAKSYHQNKEKVRHEAPFLIKTCLQICKKLQISPNWSLKGMLLKKFGFYA